MWSFIFLFILFSPLISSKEIAFTFDDAPMPDSNHFKSVARTEELIKKLNELNVPPVMIFANPCKGNNRSATIEQLKKYQTAGHLIGNHTCSHLRLDDVGYPKYSKDAESADEFLLPIMTGQKFFRFPYLNEGTDLELRDKVRSWMNLHGYRNGLVSIDNDDYFFSSKIKLAKSRGKKIDYKKVEVLFIEHLLGAVNYYDDLAKKTIGRSPKHVLLLHEMDATVMFLGALVRELRRQGWKIISINEAFTDEIYLEQPKNTYSNNGIIAQIATEKTGKDHRYTHLEIVKVELKKILGVD